MKVALSIPDHLFESAETLAKRMGVSRSSLYAAALADYVAKHQTRKVTARLDEVYATGEGGLDPSVRRAQARSLSRDSW
jgi:metal-responsive CopG/Arc/MetJ family transcriptional regulator